MDEKRKKELIDSLSEFVETIVTADQIKEWLEGEATEDEVEWVMFFVKFKAYSDEEVE